MLEPFKQRSNSELQHPPGLVPMRRSSSTLQQNKQQRARHSNYFFFFLLISVEWMEHLVARVKARLRCYLWRIPPECFSFFPTGFFPLPTSTQPAKSLMHLKPYLGKYVQIKFHSPLNELSPSHKSRLFNRSTHPVI